MARTRQLVAHFLQRFIHIRVCVGFRKLCQIVQPDLRLDFHLFRT